MKLFAKAVTLMGVFLSVACGSGSDGVSPTIAIPNVSGEWTMNGNTIYNFDLTLTQTGTTLNGSIDSTNTGDPTDSVSGTVSSEGNVVFTRERTGAWTQVYTGTVTTKTDSMVMEGTFTHSGVTGTFPWRAEKNLLPPPQGQLLKQNVNIAKGATYETNTLTAPGNGTLAAHVKSHAGTDFSVSFLRLSDSKTIGTIQGPDVNITTICTAGQTWKVSIYNPSGVAIDASITVTYTP